MRSLKSALSLSFCIAILFLTTWTTAPASAAELRAAQDLPAINQRFGDLQRGENPSFRRHLIPLLARLGCSARECHGSFQGRGGFQLSLFGSEWDEDFVQLTQKKGDEDQTHINPTDPQNSLIILKPTLQMKHKGKERYKKDSWQYNLILKWIRNGASNDAEKTGELQRLEVSPAELVFGNVGQTAQLRVLAHWVDGTVEDVTELARFKTNDETVVNISEAGLVSCAGKGDSHIVVSYDSAVAPIAAMLPVSEFAGEKFPAIASRNKVDEAVVKKLRKMGIVPSEVCSDAEFLRRVNLDLTGTLPTPDEVTRFLADASPGKRAAKIDELMKTPAYAAWWTTKFCDYTGNNSRQGKTKGNLNYGNVGAQWYSWIYKRIADNTPYDQFAADIVLATGRRSPQQTFAEYAIEMNSYVRENHPVDFANHPTLPYFWQRQNAQSPEEKALAFSHTFLGIRIECAQCHKHPFDRWTKNDFKQFTAFFGVLAVGPRAPMEGEQVNYQSVADDIRNKAIAMVEREGPLPPNAKEGKSKDGKKLIEPLKKKGTTADTTELKGSKKGAIAEPTDAKVPKKGEIADPADAKPAKKGAIADPTDANAPKKSEAADPVDAKNPKKSKADPKEAKLDAKGRKIDPNGNQKGKFDQETEQRIQNAVTAEIKRRIEAGEPVPWPELWASSKGMPEVEKTKGRRIERVITPKILGAEEVALGQFPDPRQPLMEWLRSKNNPYFAKAIVNRVWASYFSRGIVDPPDDLNLANAPANGELLDYLADAFVAHGYDLRWLHREILSSDTYQRSWKPTPTNHLDFRNFSHAIVRQLPAEVLLDAINMVGASDDKLPEFSANIETRAIGPAGNAQGYRAAKGMGSGDGYFLSLFGKPQREVNCDCERSVDPTLMQTLYTRSDPAMRSRIEGTDGKSSSWIRDLRGQAGFDKDKAIKQAFLRTLSRPPTTAELTRARADVAAADAPADAILDLLWALTNTREFKVNH